MDTIFDLGDAMIRFLQSMGAWLVYPMQIITFLGNEEFFLFVAPAVFWCLDATLGMRLGLGAMFSGVVNSAIKIGLRGPRPYWLDGSIRAYWTEPSFGVPSGHAQNATVMWGLLAKSSAKKWIWACCAAIIFLIGLSRAYLGVHFPHDVLVGWIAGAALLWFIIKFERDFLSWFNHFRTSDQVLIALGASLLMILIVAFIRLVFMDWILPEAWVLSAAQAAPQGKPIEPMALSGTISNAGAFFGLALGGIFLRDNGWFDARGSVKKRALRFLLGVLGVFIIWYGLGAIFPRGETILAFVLRYFRYALVGSWVSGVAPWLFIKIKLARRALD